MPNELDLHVELQIGGQKVNASDAYAAFELVAGADPYFTNVDPQANNVFYLSQDLRVFTVTPALDATPIPGATFGSDSSAGAYQYIQDLLQHLNGTSAFTSGSQDPFVTFPDQGGAFSGDSSVTPLSLTMPPHNNYNFAVARVRLQGTSGPSGEAQNVRVFFRLWVSQSADTDYQPTTTYAFTADAAGLPGSPQVGSGTTTIPFFATGTLATNSDYVSNGVNNQTIEIDSGDQAWAYFGCFLDVYDPANTVSGRPVQAWLAGTHHCLVAQIACDSAPILTGGAVTASPENSDKLAQRNLQVTTSDNPGGAETHRIPQTFDARPSRPALAKSGVVDELMIDWGTVPVGSLAQIFWPHVTAGEVVSLADARYAFHTLRVADSHTVECRVTRAVTYVPIPPGSGENYAGLLTIDLPDTVRTGQEFNVVVRRVVTAHQTRQPPPRPPGLEAAVPAEAPRRARQAAAKTAVAPAAPRPPGTVTTFEPLRPAARSEAMVPRAREQVAVHHSWRYVTGAFRVRIPVWTGARILPVDENILAIMKWRYAAMAPANRWRPVLKRYIDYLSDRVRGLGGDPDQIPPSLTGWRPAGQGEPGGKARDYAGTVARIVFDCHGDIEGFALDDCCREHAFKTRDPGLAEFLVRAFRYRLRILVRVCEPSGRIEAVEIVR
jgi:hypothetical protein